jgi:hypothetical protein
MSAPAGRGGNWVGANYDKVALLVVIIIIIASAGILFMKTGGSPSSIIVAPAGGESQSASVVPVSGNVLTKVLQSLEKPVQIESERRRLFVGPLRVACVAKGEPITYEATTCFFCNAPQPPGPEKADSDGDGIPDKWEKENGLNPLDPSDALGDLDKDGFTNAEEFSSGTNPKDANSKPDSASKLRSSETKVVPFKLRFLGVSKLPNGANSYQLNARTLDRTYFTTNGGVVEGWKVLGLESNATKKLILLLKQGERTLRLPQNEVITDDSFSTKLISLIEKKWVDANKNQNVKLGGVDYYVVDITQNAVVLRDASTDRQYNVSAISNDEKLNVSEPVPASGRNSPAPGP